MKKKIVGILICILFILSSIVPGYSSINIFNNNIESNIDVYHIFVETNENDSVYTQEITRELPSSYSSSNDVILDKSTFDDQLDQQQTQYNNWLYANVHPNWDTPAQSFVPTLNTLSRVELWLTKLEQLNTLNGNFKISIRENLYGNDLTYVYKSETSISRFPTYNWYMFDFPDICVKPGHKYYIVFTSADDVNFDPVEGKFSCIAWLFHNSSTFYPQGEAWGHIYNGWWYKRPSCDMTFKTYGYNAENLYPPNTPSNPDPENHATNVDINPILQWTGGDPDECDFVIYDIYFGKQSNPQLKKENHGSTNYFFTSDLDPNTKYYWKIVAKDYSGEPTTGPVWDFTTGSSGDNQPPDKPSIGGPIRVESGKLYVWAVYLTDPNDDDISCIIDWGDSTTTGWSEYYSNGSVIGYDHTYLEEGICTIKAKAKDEYGAESDWSEFHPVYIEGHNPIAVIDYIDPNIANRKIGEVIKFKGSAHYPYSEDEVKITEWEIYSKTQGGLIFCESSPNYNNEIVYEFPAYGLKLGMHKIKFRIKDSYGTWSDWSDSYYLEIVNCDWLIRAPYPEPGDYIPGFPTGGGCQADYAEAVAYLKTGIFGMRVEDDGHMYCPKYVQMGGCIDVGSNKVVKGTARISFYGAKTGGAEGRLRIGAGSAYNLYNKGVLPGLGFWSWDLILDILSDVLAFIPGVNLIKFLISFAFLEFFSGLEKIRAYNNYKSAMLKAGDYETYSITSYAVPTHTNTIAWFIAQVNADCKLEGNIFITGVFDFIKVNEYDGPADPINIDNNCKTEIEVVDPAGRIINQTFSNIPGATYSETDLDGDGETENHVYIPAPINGTYEIYVIPWDNAEQDDVFSLKIHQYNQEIILADDVSISDIPDIPYTHEAASTNPPFIKIHYPTGGEIINKTIEIEWDAIDYEDNSDLPISIFYSEDNENWTIIADKIANSGFYNWNTLTIPDGSYMLKVETTDSYGNLRDDKSDFILIDNNEIPQNNSAPLKPIEINGNKLGRTGKVYSYSTVTTDSEDDEFFYVFDWGDKNNSGWLGPYISNETVEASHIWTEKGNYEIRVKAKDIHGFESEWSDSLAVRIFKSKSYINNKLQLLFEKLIFHFPFLNKILNQII